MAIERVKLPAKARRPRQFRPRYIIIHTTQGPGTPQTQYPGTINWFRQGGTNSSPDWASSADILIGANGEEAWFTDQQGRDYRETRANWSAGYGSSSTATYGADEYGVSIETAQTAKGERPTDAALAKLIERCIALCREFDIEPVRIPHLRQLRSEPVPSGLVGHEDTENGRKSGKWDPNEKTFPWDWFIAQIRAGLADDGQAGEEGIVESKYGVVKPGEFLSVFAQRVGVSVARLVELNEIPDPNKVQAWQVLRLDDSVPKPPLGSFTSGASGASKEALDEAWAMAWRAAMHTAADSVRGLAGRPSARP